MEKAILFKKIKNSELIYTFRPIQVVLGEYDEKGEIFNTIYGFAYYKIDDSIMLDDIEDMCIGFIEPFNEIEDISKYFDKYVNKLCLGIYDKNSDEVKIETLSITQLEQAKDLKGKTVSFSSLVCPQVDLSNLNELNDREEIVINYLKYLIEETKIHFKGDKASLSDKNIIFNVLRELTNFCFLGTSIDNITFIDLSTKVQGKVMDECRLLRDYISSNWYDCLLELERNYGKINISDVDSEGHTPKILK